MARTIAAQTATAIRRELKAAFPQIKFRVTSDNFSGGNAVRVHWVNGPTNDQVRAITNKYEFGRFDGMFDIYEYTNVREDIPQVKYVTHQRHVTDDVIEEYTRYGSTRDEAHRETWKLDLSHVPSTDEDWAYLTRY